MAILEVLRFPKHDPQLRKVAQPVEEVTDEIRQIADDMLETMYDDGGVGLAAIQVGIEKRIVVMDLSPSHTEPQVFINPELTYTEGEAQFEEGCLSVPGCYGKVTRAAKVKFTALDREGVLQEYEAEAPDVFCNCIQHEINHLDGILFIDHLSKLKRDRIMKKLKKLHDIQL